jgi:hypothetical protein
VCLSVIFNPTIILHKSAFRLHFARRSFSGAVSTKEKVRTEALRHKEEKQRFTQILIGKEKQKKNSERKKWELDTDTDTDTDTDEEDTLIVAARIILIESSQ